MRTKEQLQVVAVRNLVYIAFLAYAVLYGIPIYASESPIAPPVVLEEFSRSESRKSVLRAEPLQLVRVYQDTSYSLSVRHQQANQHDFEGSPIGRIELVLLGGIFLLFGSFVTPSLWVQLSGGQQRHHHIIGNDSYAGRRKRYFFLKWLLPWIHLLKIYSAQRKNMHPSQAAADSIHDAKILPHEKNFVLPAPAHLMTAESPVLSLTKAFWQQIGVSCAAISDTTLEIINSVAADKKFGDFLVYVQTDTPLNMQHVQEMYRDTERRYHHATNRIAVVVVTEQPEISAYQQIFVYRTQHRFTMMLLSSRIIARSLRHSSCAQQFEKMLHLAMRQPDLYDTNVPVSDPLQFFGREEIITDLLDAINHVQPVGIFGVRKIGKTSLLWQVKERLTSQIAAYLDLQHLPKDCAHLYRQILRECHSDAAFKYPDARLPELASLTEGFMPENPNIAFVQDMQRLWEALKCYQHDLKIVLLLDEADAFMSQADDNNSWSLVVHELLGTLREISQRFECLVPIFVSTTPDICRLDSHHGQNNPAFHYYKEIFLTSLSEEKCNQMIADLGAQMGISYTEESLSRIYYETGGHPYITRQLCSLMLRSLSRKDSVSEIRNPASDSAENMPIIQVQNVETAVAEYLEYKRDYCESLWHRLSAHEQAILTTIAQQDSCLLEELIAEEHDAAIKRERRKAVSRLLENGWIQKCEQKYSMTMGLFEQLILLNN